MEERDRGQGTEEYRRGSICGVRVRGEFSDRRHVVVCNVPLYENARARVARRDGVVVRSDVRRFICVDCLAVRAFALYKNRGGRSDVSVGARRYV